MAPKAAIVTARISDARDHEDRAITEKGVTAQIADGVALAERLGWTVGPPETHHITENDTSAFKRRRIRLPDGRTELRTVRPEFRRYLAMLADGRADGLIAADLDRTARDPRDLEDLIDVIESSRPRIPVVSVSGSLRLENDADITMARVMVAVANKASRDTSRRVAVDKLNSARQGRFKGGGKRPFGFDADGVTIRPDEATEIRRATDALLDGVSLRQITASLRDRGVPTVGGRGWDTQVVRDILMRPRNAALMVYRPATAGRNGPPYSDDEIVGKGEWEPIVSETEWRAVTAILTDPARLTTDLGNTPRWLGSRLFRCGVCDDGATVYVTGSGKARKYRRYVCRERGDVSRATEPVDAFVTEILLSRLERADSTALIPSPGVGLADVAALRREAASLRELLDEQARLHARRVIDGRQLAAGSAELKAELGQVEARIGAVSDSSPVALIAGNPRAREIWAGWDLGYRRAVIRELVSVTLISSRRGRGFDEASVRVERLR